MGTSYSNLGNLETDRGGSAGQAILWHVQAPEIRLRLGVPKRLATCAASWLFAANWARTISALYLPVPPQALAWPPTP
jgi:hypothetical protein